MDLKFHNILRSTLTVTKKFKENLKKKAKLPLMQMQIASSRVILPSGIKNIKVLVAY
jgi:hypothetical protein